MDAQVEDGRLKAPSGKVIPIYKDGMLTLKRGDPIEVPEGSSIRVKYSVRNANYTAISLKGDAYCGTIGFEQSERPIYYCYCDITFLEYGRMVALDNNLNKVIDIAVTRTDFNEQMTKDIREHHGSEQILFMTYLIEDDGTITLGNEGSELWELSWRQ